MGCLAEVREEKRRRWEGILVEQEGSGLSVAAFCRERGVNVQTFHYWKKRLRPKVREGALPNRSFQELELVEPAPSGHHLEIIVGDVTVRVPPAFAEEDLRRVLSILAATTC
ncbi:hypothetical protein KQI84_19460 [bacterium]|nr:hypothetical protein [bacterium]